MKKAAPGRGGGKGEHNMRKLLRSIARANMKRAGFVRINKKVGEKRESFFSQNWREYARKKQSKRASA